MDEKLRFEAYVKDNATGALKKIQGALAGIKRTPGMNEATKWVGEAQVAFKGFTSVAAEVGGSMGALSVGGLAAGAGIAALAKEMKELSDRTLNLKELARQAGMTADQINQLHYAFSHFGVAAGDVDSAINHLASQMPQIRAHLGPLYADLGAYFGKSFLQRFEKETAQEQFLDLWRQLGQFSDRPQLQKQLMQEIFGSGALEPGFKEGADALAKQLERAKKIAPAQSPELEKSAQRFRDSMIDLNAAIERFNNEVGPAFLRGLAHIADDIRFILAGPTAAEQKALDQKEADRRKGFQEHQKESSDAQADKQRRGGAEDERKAIEEDHERRRRAIEQDRLKLQRLGPPDATGDPRFMPMGYRGGGGMFRLADYSDPATSSAAFGVGKMISDAVKSGTLAAFRELMGGGSSVIPGEGMNASLGGFGAAWNAAHRGRGSGGSGGGFGGSDASFPAGSTLEEVRRYIRAKAQALGIDPNIAERVARSEGLNKTLGAGGDGGTSDGPFQLHVGGGLGDIYQRKYGHSIHDKRFWRDQVDFALEQARKGGWGPWHGWRGAPWAGIGLKPDSSALNSIMAERRKDSGVAEANPFLHPQQHPDLPSIGTNPWRNPENHGRRINADPFHTEKQATLQGARHQLEAKIHVVGPAERVVVKGSNDVSVRLTRFDTLGGPAWPA